MRKIVFVLMAFLLIFTISLTIIGCEANFSFSTAKLSEAVMTLGVDSERKPLNPTNSFPADSEAIYCSAKLSNAPTDTCIKAIWIYEKGEVEDLIDYEIAQTEDYLSGTRYLSFYVTKPYNGFPRGNYKLELYIDDKLAETLFFSIR